MAPFPVHTKAYCPVCRDRIWLEVVTTQILHTKVIRDEDRVEHSLRLGLALADPAAIPDGHEKCFTVTPEMLDESLAELEAYAGTVDAAE